MVLTMRLNGIRWKALYDRLPLTMFGPVPEFGVAMRSRAAVAPLAVLALMLGGASTASAAWTSVDSAQVRGLQATDGGDILMLRQAGESTPTLAVKRAGASTLETETLPDAPQPFPSAEMQASPSGDAVISYGGITVLRNPDGTLSAPLSRWNSYAFDVSPSGAMAWVVEDGPNVAVRMRVGGELQVRTTTLIAGSPACLASRLPQVRIDGSDRAVVAWNDCAAPRAFRVATVDLSTGAAGPVQTLVEDERGYPDATYSRAILLDVNAAGAAIVAWPGDGNQVVRVARKPAGSSAFGEVTEFPGGPIGEVLATRADNAGRFHVAWRETGPGAPTVTRVAVSAAADTAFAVTELPGGTTSAVSLAYDEDGGSVASVGTPDTTRRVLVRPPGGAFADLFTPAAGRDDSVTVNDAGEILRIESPAPGVDTPGPTRISRGTTTAGTLGAAQTVACASPRWFGAPIVSAGYVLDSVVDAGRELVTFSDGAAPFRVLPVPSGWATNDPTYRALASTGDAAVVLRRADGSAGTKVLLRASGPGMASDGSAPDVAACDGATPLRFALTLVPAYDGLRVAIDCPAGRAACQGRLVLFTGAFGLPSGSAAFRVEPGRRGSALIRVPARLRDQLLRGERPPLRVVAYDRYLRTLGTGRLAG